MKAGYYFLSWLMTLFVGLIVAAGFGGELSIGFAFTAVAGVLSAPFIIIFCVVMYIYLRKKPSRTKLHSMTFLLHSVGSILTVLAITMYEPGLPPELFLAIFGYFAVDSAFFHYFVHSKHPESQLAMANETSDLLDDLKE